MKSLFISYSDTADFIEADKAAQKKVQSMKKKKTAKGKTRK